MHEDPQIPNYGKSGQGPKIKAGYVFAVEPMINLGVQQTKTLKDGWTVVTIDGQASAHAEHTIAITEQGPEVLTLVSAGAPQVEPRCGSACQPPTCAGSPIGRGSAV